MMMTVYLSLRGYRILSSESNSTVMRLRLEPIERPRSCLCCAGVRLRSKGRYERRVRHLDCLGVPSELLIECRRYRCIDCEGTFVQPLPGILPGRRSTEPWRERVYERHHDGICASTLAKREALGAATVSRIYAQFTERKAAERRSLDCPFVLGIDEHTLHRGQRFATTFCDLKNRRIFDISPGRSEAELTQYLRSLRGRERVRLACIDLSASYRAMIKRWFPNALIVADRFHVIRIVGLHLLRLARQLVPSLGWNRGWLGLLRARGERLEPPRQARLQRLLTDHPALAPVYEIKERLWALLRRKGLSKASCRQSIAELFRFIGQLRSSPFEPALTLAKTLEDWSEEIGRMWRFSRSNGTTEGFHRKMKLIQRRAYGFRSFENYRLRVIAQCG
jgi:transposase